MLTRDLFVVTNLRCYCLAGSNREAQSFLTRHSADGGTQIIVRMRGLPYTCTAEQVVRIVVSPCCRFS